MKKYNVKVKEVLERIIDVETNSKEDAKNIIQNQYDSSQLILDFNDAKETKITVKRLNKIKVGTKIKIKSKKKCLEANKTISNDDYLFINGEMDHLCGKEFEIKNIKTVYDKKYYAIMDEEENRNWFFIRKMFSVVE